MINKLSKSDDFLVAVGKTKSNSVYHIAECKKKLFTRKRIKRFYVKVFKSDLVTALRRDNDQKLHPIQWNNRNNK